MVPEELLNSFMADARKAMQAIEKTTGCSRVNFAILGNREPHVHAHLIPRYPDNEEFPDCSPWNDKREKAPMIEAARNDLVSEIAVSLR